MGFTIRAKAATLLLALAMMTGCIKEDLSDCNSNNFMLRLHYKGDGAEVVFAEKIAKVDLYVFDENNHCTLAHSLSREELTSQSTELQLMPGTYRAVCVGNAGQATETTYRDGADFTQMNMTCRPTEADGRVTTADPLYLASTAFTVTPNEKQSVETQFASSHFDVCVEVKGYDDESATLHSTTAPSFAALRTPAPLILELENLPRRTDFTNRPSQQERLSFFPQGTKEDGCFVYRFNVLRDVAASRLRLSTPAGEVRYVLDMADFLSKHPEIDLSKQEALLPIRIEFKGLDAVVSIPDWAIEDTKPEF